MKLRCTKNSIRLRLRKSELRSLAQHKTIEEAVSFPMGNKISYSLLTDDCKTTQAHFSDEVIKIIIPQHLADHWINSFDVSIETSLDLQNGESLHILIEKDFPCKDREEEDKEDTFWELTGDDKSC